MAPKASLALLVLLPLLSLDTFARAALSSPFDRQHRQHRHHDFALHLASSRRPASLDRRATIYPCTETIDCTNAGSPKPDHAHRKCIKTTSTCTFGESCSHRAGRVEMGRGRRADPLLLARSVRHGLHPQQLDLHPHGYYEHVYHDHQDDHDDRQADFDRLPFDDLRAALHRCFEHRQRDGHAPQADHVRPARCRQPTAHARRQDVPHRRPDCVPSLPPSLGRIWLARRYPRPGS